MRRSLLGASFLVLACTTLLPSQQVGTPQRDYTINGSGSLAGSYVSTGILTSTGATITNRYSTQASFAPVLWVASLTGTVGAVVFGPNSLDLGNPALGLSDLAFILNGLQPGFPGSLLTTGANNVFEITVGVPGGLVAANSIYLQFAHITATSPTGIFLSQAHRLTAYTPPPLPTGPCAPNNGVTLPLTDDSSVVQNLGFTFPFYGQNFTQITICSNGSLAFGGQTASWGPSSELTTVGFPIVHVWQRDLYPPGTANGITWYTDNAGAARVQYINLPPCCQSYTGTNGISLCADIQPGFISIMYTNGQSLGMAGWVGVGPGVAATQVAVDLSTSPTFNAGFSAYESSPTDLWTHRLVWAMDAAGNPVGAAYF